MVKLVFKVFKKLIQHFFIILFLYIKMLTRYYQKNKEKKGFKKRLVKVIKIFQKKKQVKSENMVVNNIEISLKKKQKTSAMVVNDIEIFQKMKNEGQLSIEKIILEC